MKVYPDPAKDNITIEMPKYLVVCNSTSAVPSTTVYHKWGTVFLEVYDLDGKMVFEKEFTRTETEARLDVSQWGKGMYLFRLVYNKQTVASAKVLRL